MNAKGIERRMINLLNIVKVGLEGGVGGVLRKTRVISPPLPNCQISAV